MSPFIVSFSADLVNSTASSIINLGFSVSVLASADASISELLLMQVVVSCCGGLRCTFKCCTRAARSSILALLVLAAEFGKGKLAAVVDGTGSGLINYRKGRKWVIRLTDTQGGNHI